MFAVPNFQNMDNCCRTCLNSSSNMYDIFEYQVDSYLYKILDVCTNIKVDRHDALPKKLCSTCYDCLIKFYDFRKQAKKIDKDLQLHIQDASKLPEEFMTIEIKPETDDDSRNDFDHDYNVSTDPKKEFPFISPEDGSIKFPYNKSYYSPSQQRDDVRYCCEFCKKTFRQLDKYRLHLNKHKSKTYVCNLCLKTFSHKYKYYKHLNDTHKPKPIKTFLEIDQNDENQRVDCDTVAESIKAVNSLTRHPLGQSENDSTASGRVLSCSHCSQVFNRVSDLVRHESVKHFNQNELEKAEIFSQIDQSDENKNFECDICLAKFKSVNSLSAHKRVHIDKSRILSCSSCGKVFKKTNHLKRHEMTHANRPFKCNMCPKSFLSESILKEHLNVHCNLKPYNCSLCLKSFAFISTLKKHLKTHTRERGYMCAMCGKTFDSSSNLNQHMKRHIGLKLFSCSLCPQTFVSKGELKSHNITHTGERPYSCDQCGATFAKRNSLSKHMLVHLGIRPHRCETCSMRFSSKDHLKRHIRIHTGEKPYRCDMCDRAFTQSNDLVKHRRAHLGDKLYRCSECSESFRLKTELRQHISEHFISSRLQALTVNKIPTPTENIENGEQTNNNDVQIEDREAMENVSNAMENVGNAVENVSNAMDNVSNAVENPNNVVNMMEDVQNPNIPNNGSIEQ
ncbi:zinc finger protein 260-like isoform X2 [Ostrinia nubilalis]|uniref:zinc finger protein 260-like isoform X2 n=1 Tax=Ostrinia nubilalis TaxID=29057 RepID=UPI00308266F9